MSWTIMPRAGPEIFPEILENFLNREIGWRSLCGEYNGEHRRIFLLLAQPVHSEGDQPWDFFGKNDAKAETPVRWPPHAKSWLTGKDSDAARDWGQEEKGTTEDERAGWHHWLNGRESEWTPEFGDLQGGLACCDSWGRKESDTTEWLNWTEPLSLHIYFWSFLVLFYYCSFFVIPLISYFYTCSFFKCFYFKYFYFTFI